MLTDHDDTVENGIFSLFLAHINTHCSTFIVILVTEI